MYHGSLTHVRGVMRPLFLPEKNRSLREERRRRARSKLRLGKKERAHGTTKLSGDEEKHAESCSLFTHKTKPTTTKKKNPPKKDNTNEKESDVFFVVLFRAAGGGHTGERLQ